MCIEQGFICTGLNRCRLVIELEQRELAALSIDHSKIGHDTCEQLRLPGFQ